MNNTNSLSSEFEVKINLIQVQNSKIFVVNNWSFESRESAY